MADMSGEQMQAKITAARREAEGLKDKIKRRKDELADTSRTTLCHSFLLLLLFGRLPGGYFRPIEFRASSNLVEYDTDSLQCVKWRRTRPMPSPELA